LAKDERKDRKKEGKRGTEENVSESRLLRYDALCTDISEEPSASMIVLTAEIA
jgi:hypothetical protein